MQITRAKKEELALLIHGLRSIAVVDHVDLQKRLLEQLEQELSTRFGVKVVASGEMRTACFHESKKQLNLWLTPNMHGWRDCADRADAAKLIKETGVPQGLRVE
jgi:hypothetical protein